MPWPPGPGQRLAAVPFGVLPSTTGDCSFIRTAGPAHLPLADHGVTFATNGDRGVCVCFHDPVTGR
jgi:hypothetical protein